MTWFARHETDSDPAAFVVLAHGAGSNRDAPILVATADALQRRGLWVARIDLPYRRSRPKGPPSPSGREADIAAFAEATAELAPPGLPVVWGGHSYGGRMASMAAARLPDGAGGARVRRGAAAPSALLLLSYPLHPPKAPEKARTEHLPDIGVPTLFVHGRRDPFATPDELTAAAALIPAPARILEVAAAHDLAPARSGAPELAADAVAGLLMGPR